jgi:hypothetical protein
MFSNLGRLCLTAFVRVVFLTSEALVNLTKGVQRSENNLDKGFQTSDNKFDKRQMRQELYISMTTVYVSVYLITVLINMQ